MPHTFLIADDSATTRAFIRRCIKMAGFEDAAFLEAENGLEGLGLLVRNPVDMVIADLHMPVMDGMTMTRRMLSDARFKNIPIVIASADPNTARLDALLAEGARAYVRKPFTPEAFRAAIQNIPGAAHA